MIFAVLPIYWGLTCKNQAPGVDLKLDLRKIILRISDLRQEFPPIDLNH
ncbi:hypothetical protein ACJJIC_00085 [Microbulbifer sp. ANSA002]